MRACSWTLVQAVPLSPPYAINQLRATIHALEVTAQAFAHTYEITTQTKTHIDPIFIRDTQITTHLAGSWASTRGYKSSSKGFYESSDSGIYLLSNMLDVNILGVPPLHHTKRTIPREASCICIHGMPYQAWTMHFLLFCSSCSPRIVSRLQKSSKAVPQNFDSTPFALRKRVQLFILPDTLMVLFSSSA